MTDTSQGPEGNIRRLDNYRATADRRVETAGPPRPPPPTDLGERLARVEVGLDWIKVVLTLMGALIIGGFSFLGVQMNRIENRIDTLPLHLADEFRAMRGEMAAQTSAIANSITATRQLQPQIIVVPPPQPAPAPAPDHGSNQPPPGGSKP